MMMTRLLVASLVLFLVGIFPTLANGQSSSVNREGDRERIVVLTFDDSAKTHFTMVRPTLLKYGFGATFFITEGWDFASNKKDYMTWEEIAQLHRDGFEIGNHTRDHMGVNDKNLTKLSEQLQAIEKRCQEYGIPKPISFAWPGNATTPQAFAILKKEGIRFARRGGGPEHSYESGRGFAYEPGKDHPLLLPSAGDAKPKWELADFVQAANQAKGDRIAILQFHGVPDTAHDWVSTAADKFEAYMHYLATEKFRVVALRELQNLIPSIEEPKDPNAIVRERQNSLDKIASWFNPPKTEIPGVEHRSYESKLMNTKVGYSIALPAGYEGSDRRFPVLYFLHGRGGNESSPGNAMLVEILRKGIDAGTLPPMILVFPSGGQHTVYCDSVDGKYLSQSTFILELIPHIDATYRTIASKKGRAIQGMSMGGCGAFQMALKHPELFSSSLSYAGGFVDAETMKGRVAMINEAMFGGDESRWMAENPVTLAGRVTMEARASLPLRLVCGSQDISLSDTMRMRNALLALQWDHDYLEYAGIPHHFGKLLEAEGDAGLQFAAKHFALSPATP